MNAVVETVRALVVPMSETKLVVPNVAIAEVINSQPLEIVEGAPEWLVGRLGWRGQDLPVISFERLSGWPAVREQAGSRISIMNSVIADTKLPFYAMITAGIPSLFAATEESLPESCKSEKVFPETVADCVTISGSQILIPDLEVLQRRTEEAWEKLKG